MLLVPERALSRQSNCAEYSTGLADIGPGCYAKTTAVARMKAPPVLDASERDLSIR
jgi:hypothetical protein